MKITMCIKTENGQTLTDPADGFIICGCIFASQIDENGNPTGGLFGSSKEADLILNSGAELRAYTVKEFIRGLMIDPYTLKQIAEDMIKKT